MLLQEGLGYGSRNDGGITSNLEWYADTSQKWIAHLVSRGLGLAYHCHSQRQKDSGAVNPKHCPHQQYQPELFYWAPTEVFRAKKGSFALRLSLGQPLQQSHSRSLSDSPGLKQPNYCFELLRTSSRPRLQDVGYFFWDRDPMSERE